MPFRPCDGTRELICNGGVYDDVREHAESDAAAGVNQFQLIEVANPDLE